MLRIIAVKDMKAQLFFHLTLLVQPSKLHAPSLTILMIPNLFFSQHPNEFRLFHLADFDEETGKISILEHMSDLGSAADHQTQANQNTLPFPQHSGSN